MGMTGTRLSENEEFMRLLRNGNLNDVSLAKMFNCSPAWVCILRKREQLGAVKLHQNGKCRGKSFTDDEILNAVFLYDDLQEAADSIGCSEGLVRARLSELGVHLR